MKEEMEKYKKQGKNIVVTCFIIAFALIILLLILTILTKLFPLLILIPFILTTILLVGIILYSVPYGKYRAIYKEYYVKEALESVFTDLVYKPSDGLPESIIRETEMMNMGDKYSSNDYISGKYKDINVEQADVTITEERERKNSDGETEKYNVTIFRGKWLIFDFNKPFKANMQIREKSFSNSRLNNWNQEVKFKKVILEDGEFNNTFRVYAQDEEEAFYILTPHFMDKIKKVAYSVSGQLLFCFIDNKLHIGLYNNNDSFEPSLSSNLSEEQIKNKIVADIKVITNFVDQLNLDNDLFKKEV